VSEGADAVWAHVPWRRRDRHPEKKNLILIHKQTGRRITNFQRIRVNREFADLVFQAEEAPGEYYLYYLPHVMSGSRHYPTVTYPEPEETADPSWLERNNLTRRNIDLTPLPRAELRAIEAIDDFNSFEPMEVIALARETIRLLDNHPSADYLLFPESRENSIRMTDDLPLEWIKRGPGQPFHGKAARGEFFAFQVGVFACRKEIKGLDVRFSAMKGPSEARIPAEAFRCFNTGGIDWTRKPFQKVCTVEKGKVRALWCGVQVPMDLPKGEYSGTVIVAPEGMKETAVDVTITVTDEVLEDAGDGEPGRLSRLRWLDSTLAWDDGIVPPYIPMSAANGIVTCLGRSVRIGDRGLPESMQSFFAQEMTCIQAEGNEILTGPIELVVEDGSGAKMPWKGGGSRFLQQLEGAVTWEAQSAAGPLTMQVDARMEFDGCLEFIVRLSAAEPMDVSDIRLEIPMAKDTARYMMGMGEKGGFRPARFEWKWDWRKNQDSIWLGKVNAGLQSAFRAENYARPLNTNFYLSKPLNMPPSWYNEGKGGCTVGEKDGQTVLITAYSGARNLKPGEPLFFDFNLLFTPFRPLDTKAHFTTRYYHKFSPLEEIAETGANTINVHHATEINPYINYPFLRPDAMKAYIDKAHAMGLKVKIYYTVRELSNRAPEIFALRSLGHEILSSGPGGGFSWLQEHLGDDYIAAWFVPELKDAAVINSGVSRWHNYYVEGLNWLVKNVGIDGLYIDDVAFDRSTMKRVRKVLDRGREGALIDLHSANQFNVRDGFANSANLYMEHFPYIDRLWFGEYFDYDSPPEFWLIETSGIPFGLMGEMLQNGGNPWRGMLYGMTSRLPWAGDPTHLWRVWDSFGIHEARMIGCWVPGRPVKTGREDVLATTYVKKNRVLLSLASWADETVGVRLRIDWDALGMDRSRVVLEAPFIKDFQEEARFSPGDEIPVESGKGWLLLISQQG